MKCRLCLIECHQETEVSIFNNDEESNLTKLITKYLYIEVTQLDAFSTAMCKDCVRHLNEFHKFFQYVEEQQKMLQNEFLEIKCLVDEKLLTGVENVSNDFEHNDESLLDMKEVINDDEICQNGSISVEEFDYADKHINSEAEKEAESEEDIPLKSLLDNVKAKKSTKKTTLRPRSAKLKVVEKIIKRKYTKRKQKNDESNREDITLAKKEKRKKYCLTREESMFRDEVVSKYLQLKCEICNECTKTYNDLKIHFRQEHKRKAYITCCGTRYLRRFLLWDHIQSHLNPDRFKCEICKKILKSRSSFKLHMANMHVDRNKMKHACHICNKKFPFLSVLNSHMVVHSEETNHACKSCGKGFKTDYMLKMHIQHVHEKKAPFMCESCGKEYRFKQSFERHIAEHQGRKNEPTEQCQICGQWLRYNCLRRHMQRHENRTFECEVCSKICKSKSALTSHIAYCHKMKQIHSCTFCEKTFKRPLRLKEHMAVHTGQKDYNCPHCSREFRSSANMYMHIKKMHVVEWTKAQIARNQGPTQSKDEQKETSC